MRLNEKKNLKLVCKNQEDLKVISAYLQDSIVSSKDIKFLKKNRIFLMIVNRFMWEDVEKGVFRESKRIRCAIKFEHVLAVKSKQVNQKNKNKYLGCLAIKSEKFPNNNHNIKILFSGESVISLVSEVLEVYMQDLGSAWNTKHIPVHKI